MDFKQLESFVAVVDEGSFSNAAERLQLSQSMVTIHVRNLENELGTRLLNRTTRSMELSADGRTYYYYARQILKLNRDSLFAIKRADQNSNAINIVATPYTSRYFLSGKIAEFRRKNPEATFNITVCYNSEIPNKLRDSDFQFAFCNMKIMDNDYNIHLYNSSGLVIITPNTERFRALQGHSFPTSLLEIEPMITRASTSAMQQEFLAWLKKNAPEAHLNIAVSIDDTETIKQLVADDIGISVISEAAIGEYLKSGKLLSFPLEGTMPHHLYFVSKKKYLSEAQRKFRDFITASAE